MKAAGSFRGQIAESAGHGQSYSEPPLAGD
jgi:hypothetical protein